MGNAVADELDAYHLYRLVFYTSRRRVGPRSARGSSGSRTTVGSLTMVFNNTRASASGRSER